jgi:hypothetical protein
MYVGSPAVPISQFCIPFSDLVNSETLNLPWSLIKLWQPLLEKINSMQQIELFIQELLKEAVGARPVKVRLLNGWIYNILQATSNHGKFVLYYVTSTSPFYLGCGLSITDTRIPTCIAAAVFKI